MDSNNLPEDIILFSEELKMSLDPWEDIKKNDLFSPSLTELFCDFSLGEFIALAKDTAYHFSYIAPRQWAIAEAGKPSATVLDKGILNELCKEYPWVKWILPKSLDDQIETQFEKYFHDRLGIIIDTAYANLK